MHPRRLYDCTFYGALLGIAGIALGVLVPDSILAILCAVFFAIGITLYRWSRGGSAWRTILPVAGILLGCTIYAQQADPIQPTGLIPGEQVTVRGVVATDPIDRAGSIEFTARLAPPHSGRLRTYHAGISDAALGDEVVLSGRVTESRYGTMYMSNPDIQILSRNIGFTGRLVAVKQRLLDVLRRMLPANHAALAGGLLLGERADFSPAFEDALRRSGTTHIVALSGYNVSVIATLLSILGFAALPAPLALPAMGGILAGFVVMTGAEASLIRAAIMGSIAFVAHHTGNRYGMRNAIALAAVGMLLWSPHVLLSPGFQLSFAALWGVVYLKPRLFRSAIHDTQRSLFQWRESMATTIAAQIAVSPILLATFGGLSVTAVAANVAVLWSVPIAMLASALTAGIGIGSPIAATPVAWIAHGVLSYQIAVIHFFSGVETILHP